MFIRETNLTIAALCLAGAAVAQQLPSTGEPGAPVQVAAAQVDTPVAAGPAVAAQRQVRGALRGVLAAADQGPDALRRYIWSTRAIYNYPFEDFARPEWDR